MGRGLMRPRLSSIVALGLAGAALACPAVALDDPDNWSVSFGAATDYRSKGLSKTQGDPYAWGQVEWQSDDEQLYVELGAARVKQSFGSELETELRAGFRPEFGGFSFDFNAMYRDYPDANPGADDDYWEFSADASRSIGPVSGRLRVQYSPDNAGASHAFTYVEGRAGYRLTRKLRATAALGHRDTQDSIDYTAWNVGLDYRVDDNVGLDLRWYDTDCDGLSPQYDHALVAAVNFGF
jgi:uncharacterized protein (TIGR02001 family)